MSERDGATPADLQWLLEARKYAGDDAAVDRFGRIIVSVRRADVFRQTATEQLAVASRLAQEATQMRDVFRRIKNMVCGERNPRWSDDWATTNTRGQIADLCDSVLSAALRSSAEGAGT